MINRKIKMILFAIVLSFLVLILYLSYFQLVDAEKLVKHPYNTRNWVDENKFQRGSIKDRNGNILGESVKDNDGGYTRVYKYGDLFSQIIGYSSKEYGKTGLELKYNDALLNITEATPIDGLKNLVLDKVRGKDIVTTLDLSLQQFAKGQLEGHRGAIILMNPKTGEIYSMYSNPSFNPNELSANWENLINDQNAPLLNRATQGLYTPGSVIKVVTAASILESGIDVNYEDKGNTVVSGYTINNFENEAHGSINLEWALVHSSNAYFVDKALEVGAKGMAETFNRFNFNGGIPFDIPTESSRSPFKPDTDTSALAAAAYGQGTTLVTPLQMALSASAIANEGKMPIPKLVKSFVDENNNVKNILKSETLMNSTSKKVADEIKNDMKTVVENYTTATTYNVESGGKTGTAETANNSTHAWYIGFCPVDNPKFVVTVILEEDGTLGGKTAAPIGAAMLDKAYLTIKD